MKKFISTLTGLTNSLILAAPAYATDQPPSLSLGTPSWVKITDLGYIVTQAIQLILIIAAILSFVFLVWGGIAWITSGGDKAQTQAARDRMTAAIIGLVIVAASWALFQIITYFLGVDLTQSIPKGYS